MKDYFSPPKKAFKQTPSEMIEVLYFNDLVQNLPILGKFLNID